MEEGRTYEFSSAAHFLHGGREGQFFCGCTGTTYDTTGGDDADSIAGGLFRNQAAASFYQKIELSEAGRTLLPHAKRSVELVRQTDEAMSAFTQKLQGRLQLGASLTIGEYVLPRMLGPFARQYPDISIVMKVMNTTQIMDEILKHQLNFGLIEAPIHHPDMIVEPVMQDELKLIVPAGHDLAGRGKVNLEEVMNYPFVLREEGSGTRQVMEGQLQKKKLTQVT